MAVRDHAGPDAAFRLGLIAGMRTMTPPAAVAWAARSGRLPLEGTRLGFLAAPAALPILLVLAAGELVTDTLPWVGSRTRPEQFAARLASGALAGAALTVRRQAGLGVLAGLAGATVGTFASAAVRSGLARLMGDDRLAALIEDAAALSGAALLIGRLRRM